MDIENHEKQKSNITRQTRVQVLYESGVTKPKTILKKIQKNYHHLDLRTVQRDVKMIEESGICTKKEYDTTNRYSLN